MAAEHAIKIAPQSCFQKKIYELSVLAELEVEQTMNHKIIHEEAT